MKTQGPRGLIDYMLFRVEPGLRVTEAVPNKTAIVGLKCVLSVQTLSSHNVTRHSQRSQVSNSERRFWNFPGTMWQEYFGLAQLEGAEHEATSTYPLIVLVFYINVRA